MVIGQPVAEPNYGFTLNIKIKSELYGDSIQNIEKAIEWYNKYFAEGSTEYFHENYDDKWGQILNGTIHREPSGIRSNWNF